jgi:phage shock protein PspC (stress-responsive transcriptional regulator)
MDSEGRRLLQRVHQETEDHLNLRPRAFQAVAVAGVVAGIATSLNAPVTSLAVAVTLPMALPLPMAVTPQVR